MTCDSCANAIARAPVRQAAYRVWIVGSSRAWGMCAEHAHQADDLGTIARAVRIITVVATENPR